MSSDGYCCTLLNPKKNAFALIEVFNMGDENFQIRLAGDPDMNYIGRSYVRSGWGGPGDEYKRIDTPSGVTTRKVGLGLMLYAGTAIGVTIKYKGAAGVYSTTGERSDSAERFWQSAIKSGLATEDDSSYSDTGEHCETIRHEEYGEGGRITSDEVCGSVDVEYDRSLSLLSAESVYDSGMVVHTADKNARFTRPPDDLLAVGDPGKDAELAWRLGEVIGQRDKDMQRSYLSRPDVQDVISTDDRLFAQLLEMFGQTRLPGVAGLGGAGRHRIRQLPLPPLSSASRNLVARFADVP